MKKPITAIMITLFLASTLSMAFNIAPVSATPDSGIVGLWHFDESTGSTASDSSGYGNDGTLSGGKFGNALYFDGTGDYLSVDHDGSLSLTGAFTVEAWVYRDSSSLGSLSYVLSKDDGLGDAESNYNLLFWSDNKLALFLQGLSPTGPETKGTDYWNTGGGGIIGETSVLDDGWHHVAGVYTGSALKVYVDGILDGEVPVSGTPHTNTAELWIGNRKYNTVSFFGGRIDEVRISNIARYTGASFTVQTSPFSKDVNTMGLWHIDESTGSTVEDASDYLNDGTFVGDPEWAGPSWTTGVYGSALQFDGVDDYVEISDSTSLDLTEFTIEAWVYIEELKRYNAIIIKGADGAENYELLIGYPTVDDVVSAVRFTDGRDWLATGGVISLNTWHHIAVTYGSTEWKIYVDGTIEADRIYGAPRTPATNNLHLWIGNEQGTSGRVTNGKIDEARIWNRVLSPVEVKRHCWGLVGEWLFDEGSSTTAYDTSGFENHGTIYGAAKTTGRYGTALSFDGSNDRVEIASSPNLQLSDKGTLEFWFIPGLGFNGHDAFVIKGDATGSGGYSDLEFGVNRHLNDGSIKGWISDHTGFDIIYTNTKSWTVGQWYHIAFTWDGSNLNIYVNGESDATPVPQTRNAYIATDPVTLGRIRGHWYNGLLDELRIYNTALIPIKFDQTGLDDSATGELVVTVSDPIELEYEDLPYVMMVEGGTEVTYTYEQSVSSNIIGKRYSLDSVTGGASPSDTITVINPTTITGNYVIQYETSVDINPDTLNLKSNGQWITAYITLPEGYSVEDINVNTIKLKNTDELEVTADWGEVQDGILMVKFDRSALTNQLGTADMSDGGKFYTVTLIVTGLLDGTPFEGIDTINVLKK